MKNTHDDGETVRVSLHELDRLGKLLEVINSQNEIINRLNQQQEERRERERLAEMLCLGAGKKRPS